MTTCLGKASVFRKLLSVYVFSYFPFGFEGRMWDLIVSVSDHCLSFYFSNIKIVRTRAFQDVDVGSDHDMVMMTFYTCLRKSRKPTKLRIRFDIEMLSDPTVVSAFQAIIGGRFAPQATLVDENADLDLIIAFHLLSIVTRINKAIIDTAAEPLSKQRRKWKPWVTSEILGLYNQ